MGASGGSMPPGGAKALLADSKGGRGVVGTLVGALPCVICAICGFCTRLDGMT